jgi:hypothetical protein
MNGSEEGAGEMGEYSFIVNILIQPRLAWLPAL